jgi:predicted anti-sigma-YlaC factor YlaD
MVACVEQLISEYVDGELPPSVARELEQHLGMCGACRAMLVEYCALVAATHLLAVTRWSGRRLDPTEHELHQRNVLGQARTSDLLA